MRTFIEQTQSTIRDRMATGTFTFNQYFVHKNSKRAYKNMRKTCKSFKLDKSNAVSIGTTAIKPYLSKCPVDLVWFARCCGKMYSCHLFSYSGLQTVFPNKAQK